VIVDASALVALLLQEPGWERIADALTAHDQVAIGAPTLTEAAIVLHAKNAPPTLLPALLRHARIEVLPFTEHHANLAAEAYATYGRGRHAASLNFGDCMTYAVASAARAPLLYVGDDFARTDLEPALRD
jgi:ribonuclease VapC